MTRRNWAAIAGLMLGFTAVASYFTVVTTVLGPRLPALRDTPLLNFALLAAGVWLSVAGLRRARAMRYGSRRPLWAALGVGLNLVLAAFFSYYVFGFSAQLPASTKAPRVGDAAPDFTLPDQTGQAVQLASLQGHNLLLVFYRGHW